MRAIHILEREGNVKGGYGCSFFKSLSLASNSIVQHNAKLSDPVPLERVLRQYVKFVKRSHEEFVQPVSTTEKSPYAAHQPSMTLTMAPSQSPDKAIRRHHCPTWHKEQGRYHLDNRAYC